MTIVDYRLEKLSVPCEPGISDASGTWSTAHQTYLELESDGGHVGVGLGFTRSDESPSDHADRFESVADELLGESPFAVLNRVRLPSRADWTGGFQRAVDLACWDLCGKISGLPVFELMGGADSVVPAYASGLCFDHDEETTREVYAAFAELGFDAAKVKVGYPTVEEDLDRLELVRDVLGENCTLAIDLNCTWTPEETIDRVERYRDAGISLAWIEDPVSQADPEAARTVQDALPSETLNYGEYLEYERTLEFLEAGVVDMLNLRRELLSSGLEMATLGTAHGAALHVGDIQCELGAHLAAALPGRQYVEYWQRPWDLLAADSIQIQDGHFVLPRRPGHGVTISAGAIDRYRVEPA